MFRKNLMLFYGILSTSVLFARPSLLGKTSYKAGSIKDFKINLAWEDLEIVNTDDDEITVEIYCNKKKYAPTVKESSSTLCIETQPFRFGFAIEKKECVVVVSVPQGKTFEKAIVNISSGDVQIQNVTADSLTLHTSSGDILVSEGKASKLSVTASSGDVSVNNFTSQDSKFTSSSGNIKLNTFETQTLHSTASSGNITANRLFCQSFNVSTSSGTIGLELDSTPVKKSEVSTSSGTVYVSLPGNSSVDIKATTSSGSFTNTFTKEVLSSHAGYSRSINGGGAEIAFSSSSGSITVDSNDSVSSAPYIPENDTDIPVVIFDDAK